MVRATSAAVYEEIKTNGLLSAMRWRVYSFLYQHGPLTSNELDAALKGPEEVGPSYHKRLSELQRLGVVQELGTRACKVSSNQCVEWDVTASLPLGAGQRASARPTPKEMAKAVDELRSIFRELGATGRTFTPELLRVCGWLAEKTK